MPAIRVLYVDDEPNLLEIAKVYLEMNGEFVVEISERAYGALEILSASAFDAVISDYQMPEMDGIAFLKKVRLRYGTLPFILFTGRGREEVVVEALNSGADYYLQKGGDPTAQFTELAHKIRHAVDKRRAEQALAESESRFRDLTENSLDTIMLFDRNLRHLYVNPNAEVQSGIPAARYIGKTHAELGFPPHLCNLWQKTLQAVFDSGKNQRIEFQLPSGIWIDWLVVPIHDPDGTVVQAITSARDITERRKAEEQLRLAEFSLEHSGITTFWLGEDARVIRANQAACDTLGYTREEFTHLRVFDFDPSYSPELWKQIWDRIAREKYVVIESIHKRKDTTTFPVEIASTFFDYEGKELIHSFARDITERKRSEAAIQKSEAKYRTLFEQSKDAMLVIDDNRFTDCNTATLAMLGMTSKDEFTSLHPSEVSPPTQPDGRDSFEKAEEMMAIALRDGSHRFEWVHRRVNGDLFWAEVCLTAIPLGEKRIIHTSWRDITDRKKAEEGLKAAYEKITASEEELRANYDELAHGEQLLRESEAKYRTLFERSKDPMLIIDNHRFVDCNASALAVLGLESKAEILDLHPSRLSPEQQPDGRSSYEVAEEMMAIALREGSCKFEWLHMRPDGKTFWDEISLTVIPLGGRQVIHTAWRDINDRKKAEEELRAAYEQLAASEEELRANFDELAHSEQRIRESEHRLSDIINFSPDATFAIDTGGKVIAWNRAIEDLTGTPASLMLGKGEGEYALPFYGQRRPMLIDLIDAPLEHLNTRYSHIVREGPTLSAETSVRIRGKARVVSAKATRFFNERGEMTGAIESMRDITPLREAEDALREREAFFRGLFDQASQLAGVLDLEGNLIRVNNTAMAMTGTDSGAVLGHPFWETPWWAHDPEQQARVKDAVARARNGESIRFEATHHDPVGKIHYIDFSLKPVVDDGGKVIALLPEGRDITERRMAEMELRESEEKFRQLISSAPIPLSFSNVRGEIEFSNTRFSQLFGYAPGEIPTLEEWFTRAYPDPGYRKEVLAAWNHAVRRASENGTDIEPLEYRVTAKDGSVHDVIISGITIGGKHLASFIDITARRKAEEALRLAEFSIEHSGLSTFWFDRDSRIVRVNEATCTALGYTREELLGMRVRDIDPNFPTQEQWDRSWRQTRELGEYKVSESVHRRKDGTTFPVEIVSSYFTFGEQEYLLSFVRDITERKLADAVIRESEERYRSVVNDQTEMIARFTPDGVLTFVNEAHRSYYTPRLGLTEVIGRKIWDIMQVQNYDLVGQFLRSLTPEHPVREMERVFKGADGKSYWQVWSVRALFDSRGAVSEYQVVGRDITEQKMVEEALKRSEEQFRAIARTIPGVLYQFYARKNGEMGLYYLSDRAEEIFGISGDLSTFFPRFTACVAPEDRDAFLRSINEAIRTVSKWDFRGKFIRGDGRVMFFHGLSEPVLGHEELVFHGMLIDSSEENRVC